MWWVFAPIMLGMMASFVVAQSVEWQRPWILAGLACFAACVAMVVYANGPPNSRQLAALLLNLPHAMAAR